MNELKGYFLNKEYRNYFLIFIIISILATFCLFTQKNYESPFKEIIILIISLIIGIISITSYIKDKEIYKTAIIIILLFGLMCVFLSPIGSVSDEAEHFTRSEITSQGVLFQFYYHSNGQTHI